MLPGNAVKKEIITITGGPGTGTLTGSRKVAASLGYEFFSSGDLFRIIAKRHGVSVEQLHLLGATTDGADDEVDGALSDLKDRSKLVIDSRLAFYWIPDSFKVCFVANPRVAAERVFKHIKTDGRESQTGQSVEEVYEAGVARRANEHKRYQTRYGVDMDDMSQFDLIVDTSENGIEATADLVIRAYQYWLAA